MYFSRKIIIFYLQVIPFKKYYARNIDSALYLSNDIMNCSSDTSLEMNEVIMYFYSDIYSVIRNILTSIESY